MLAYRNLSADLFYSGHPELSQFTRDADVGHAVLTSWLPPSVDSYSYYAWPASFIMYNLSYSYIVYYPRWIADKVILKNIGVSYNGQPISHYPRFINLSEKTYGSCEDKVQITLSTLTCTTSVKIWVDSYYIDMYNAEVYLFGPQTGSQTINMYKYYTYYTSYTYSHIYNWTTYYNYTVPASYTSTYTYTTQYTYTTLYNYLYTGASYSKVYA